MPEVNGEQEEEITCPLCGHEWTHSFSCTLEFEMGDYAPDYKGNYN